MKLFLLLLSIFLLTGCRREAPALLPPPEPEQSQAADLFVFQAGNRYLAVNDLGQVVLEVDSGQMSIVRKDAAPVAIMVSRSEGSVTDEYGWTSPEKEWIDFYSIDGRFRYDLPLSYAHVDGNMISGYDAASMTSRLYRLDTGALLYDNVGNYFPTGDGYYVSQYDWEAPGMFLDKAGNEVSRLEQGYIQATAWDDYLIHRIDDRCGLVDSRGQEVLPCQYQNLTTGEPGTVYAQTEDGTQVVEVATGNILFSWDQEICYYDGAHALVDTGAFRYQLIDLQGNPLLPEAMAWPSLLDTDKDGYTDLFQSNNMDYTRSYLFRPDGTIIWQADSGVWPTVIDRSTALVCNYNDQARWSLLDLSTGEETPLAAGEGVYYSQVYNIDGVFSSYLIRECQNQLGWPRCDILDLSGKVLQKDLQDVVYRQNGVFQCKQGFTAGLIKEDGTWLYRESSFSQMED